MAIAGRGDLDDESAHPAAGQAEPLGHGPLAQRLPGRDRRHVRRADLAATDLKPAAVAGLLRDAVTEDRDLFTLPDP